MITLTDAARDRVLKVMEMQGRTGHSLRVRIAGRGASGYKHELGFVAPGEESPEDTVFDEKGIHLIIDKGSVERIKGTSIDYVENLDGAGFVFENPNPVTYSDQAKGETIQELFENTVNPGLAMHGGSVELLDVKDNNVYVRLGGGCQGCGMANVTLKQGIERMIKAAVPDIEAIIDTTDHADGKNPYYAPSQ